MKKIQRIAGFLILALAAASLLAAAEEQAKPSKKNRKKKTEAAQQAKTEAPAPEDGASWEPGSGTGNFLVRFENGREIAATAWRKEGENVLFTLPEGGELGLPAARVRKVEDAEGAVAFIIMETVGREAGGPGTSGGGGEGSYGSSRPGLGGGKQPLTAGMLAGGSGSGAQGQNPQDGGTSTNKPKDGSPAGDTASSLALVISAPASVATGQVFDVTVSVSGASGLGYVGFYLAYPADTLEALSAQDGGFMASDGEQTAFLQTIRQDRGLIIVGASRYSKEKGVSGSGTVLRAQFKALKAGPASLSLQNASARNFDRSQALEALAAPLALTVTP